MIYKTNIEFGPKQFSNFARLNYSLWYALAEFVDNSTQSVENFKTTMKKIFKKERTILRVEITYDEKDRTITIEDNSIGMNRQELDEALNVGVPTKHSKGRSEHGMGMKASACWLGNIWSIQTTKYGSGEECLATIDVKKVSAGDKTCEIKTKKVSKTNHGTTIKIWNSNRRFRQDTLKTASDYLASIYRLDIRAKKLNLIINKQQIKSPDNWIFAKFQSGRTAKENLNLKINKKRVTGWIGLLKEGMGQTSRKHGGFSLFKHGRQLVGFPNAWKPAKIFGGVADEGANNLLSQRLVGEIHLNDFVTAHTKDHFAWLDDEQDQLVDHLERRYKKYDDLIETLKAQPSEFMGDEKVKHSWESLAETVNEAKIQDLIRHPNLPSIDTIVKANKNQLQAKSKKDFVGTLNLGNGYTIKGRLLNRSPNDKHFLIEPNLNKKKEVHITINRLHPYFRALSNDSRFEELLFQYIADALAEYMVSQQHAEITPAAIRHAKDQILRAKIDILNKPANNNRKKKLK
jgi:hypothetical protein